MKLIEAIFDSNKEISVSSLITFISISLILSIIMTFFIVYTKVYGKTAYWYCIILILNLINILIVLIYYKSKTGTYIGISGKKGKYGIRGERGKFLLCSFCDNNIYIQKSREKYPVGLINAALMKIGSFTTSAWHYRKYIELKGDYKTFDASKTISIDESTKTLSQSVLNNLFLGFSLYGTEYLGSRFMIEEGPKGKLIFGKFYRPKTEQGFFPIGDTVLGGDETAKLNTFTINGNIRTAISFDRVISLKDKNLGTYTIWKPVPPDGYVVLGDVISRGTRPPSIDTIGCVPEDCVKEIPEKNLIFIGFSNPSSFIKAFGPDYYTIDINKFYDKITKSNTGFFSIWRTPMNTFLCQYNKIGDNHLEGSLLYNMVYGDSKYLNKNGTVKNSVKNQIISLLKSVKLPQYFVKEIIREFRIEFRGITSDQVNMAYYVNEINNVSENTNLYNLTNLIFPKGLNFELDYGDGGFQAGVRLLPIQLIILELLRNVFTTQHSSYMIKNECLAYSRVNQERRKIIVKLRKAIKDNDSYMEIYRNGNCTNSKQISQKIRIFDSNLVRNLRHINDYMDKLRNSQYDEFTTSRLQLVLSEFDSLNQFMSKQICRYVD